MSKWLILLALSGIPVWAGEFCVVKNTNYEQCHYYTAAACEQAAAASGGACIYRDTPASTTSKTQGLNNAVQDFGNTMAETGRAVGEAKAREESQEIERARFRVELGEKAARFDREFPGEPNPFRAEIDRMQKAEKAKEEARVLEEKQTQESWKIVGILLGGLFLVLALASAGG